MDAKQLAEIEARAKAATEGPWRDFDGLLWLPAAQREGYETTYGNPKGADATFCAHARQDIPALTAALRLAWARIEQHKMIFEDYEEALMRGQDGKAPEG
jgi:hypothetical protein